MVNKEKYVKELGELFNKFGVGQVESLEYYQDEIGDEWVRVTFQGGATRRVNVTWDSLTALTRDVTKHI